MGWGFLYINQLAGGGNGTHVRAYITWHTGAGGLLKASRSEAIFATCESEELEQDETGDIAVTCRGVGGGEGAGGGQDHGAG